MLGRKSPKRIEAWKRIGAALTIGKAHALRVTGANQAWGQCPIVIREAAEFNRCNFVHSCPLITVPLALTCQRVC